MMTIEGPTRILTPRHRVCAWMAALATVIGRDDEAYVYLLELAACACDGAKQGDG